MDTEFGLVFFQRTDGKEKLRVERHEDANSQQSYTVGWMLGDVIRNFADDEVHEALHGLLDRSYVGAQSDELVGRLLHVIVQYRKWQEHGSTGSFWDAYEASEGQDNGT
jgi:hypothetical protein